MTSFASASSQSAPITKHVAGNYYKPRGSGFPSSTTNYYNGYLKFSPWFLDEAITINALATGVYTAYSGGNVKVAVYASDPTTLKPTGNPLASTGNMSTTVGTTVVSAAVGPTSLQRGLYWIAAWCDNATVTGHAVTSASVEYVEAIGSSNSSAVISFSALVNAVYYAYTFAATWPNVTGFTFGENVAPIPFQSYKVASVP